MSYQFLSVTCFYICASNKSFGIVIIIVLAIAILHSNGRFHSAATPCHDQQLPKCTPKEMCYYVTARLRMKRQMKLLIY